MESQTDFFHHLPDEVAQLIFSRINDYKTLIQCMFVSKCFRQQAVRVPSLLIVCPGNFSSYDERLHRIFAMVKAFKNLKSLVVRVGQPREEPLSWARCMRYAEIGGSVEKFVFMAAKCGDFSELDSTLLGLDSVGHRSQEGASTGSDSMGPLMRQDSMERSNNPSDADGNRGYWDYTQVKEGFERVVPGGPVLEAESKQAQQGNSSSYTQSTPFDASIKRNPLSQFTLRQVIAPSNDVLKRMLPVIHFAIVQGLNELRDSLPAFVAQFSELTAFVLVDMVESITVYLREHHIQELKSSYMQALDEFSSIVEAPPKVERHLSQLFIREDQGKGSSGKDEGKGCMAGMSSKSGDFGAMEDSRCIEEPQSSSSKMLPSRLLQRFDRCRLPASKGKEKLVEEFESETECRLTSSHEDWRSNDSSDLDSCTDFPERSVIGECSSPLKDGPIGSESSQSESLRSSLFAGETTLESYTPLEAFSVSVDDHPMSSEAIAEHVDSLNGKSDCQGEGHGKARDNVYRLQGNKCFRDSKADLTNRYSLRRCHKPDSWKKKDCMSLGFLTGIRGTGGLYCNNLSEENFDVQGSQMHACDLACRKDEQALGDDMTLIRGGSDDTSSVRSREHDEGGDCRSINERAISNSEVLSLSAVKGSQMNEQQVSSSSSLRSLQAWQSEAYESMAERVVPIDSWQERLRRLRDSLHVDPVLELNRTHGSRELQPLVPEVPGAVRADSWRHVWQERVRRLGDSLHMDPGQEFNGAHDYRRERLRDLVIRKRHRAMEKDALSFDYTFWRADQVSSCKYVMSDLSMCIATHAARPLRDAEKEVLAQAAIAGPLLVGTVSHVNKHYPCHHL
ncbi:hypothetical protein GOP47_0013017 [Adiantum capillus-veneris]|uniref:F-box domain-containing protein n=1 Tax=Adiantum capillus-veneris TaxID=13818 RepID=A0A9D4ZHC8_ADICA|nr:hypothetical protein GOP47_0013017 [Adiantum capillus-veneris]